MDHMGDIADNQSMDSHNTEHRLTKVEGQLDTLRESYTGMRKEIFGNGSVGGGLKGAVSRLTNQSKIIIWIGGIIGSAVLFDVSQKFLHPSTDSIVEEIRSLRERVMQKDRDYARLIEMLSTRNEHNSQPPSQQ